MSLRSMTGFARVRKAFAEGEVVVSLKSVNHRGLDLHFHMPAELDAIENDVRGAIKTGVVRGHVQIQVELTRTAGDAAGLNRPLLDLYMTAFREAAKAYEIEGQWPDLNAAMGIPGMLRAGGEAGEIGEEVVKAVLEATAEAVAALNVCREREGAVTAA